MGTAAADAWYGTPGLVVDSDSPKGAANLAGAKVMYSDDAQREAVAKLRAARAFVDEAAVRSLQEWVRVLEGRQRR